MSAKKRKWPLYLVQAGVCALAVWYLSGKVRWNDHARLAADPSVDYVLAGETEDTLRLIDPATHAERTVPRSALAARSQLPKGQRPIDPGIHSILQKAHWSWAALALLTFSPVTFVMAWRLRLMLTTQDIHISMRDAILMTFGGNFFNFFLPGTIMGDAYKAYHIARKTHKRTEGITIVLLDRVIGLVSFLIISAGAIMVSWQVQVGSEPMLGRYGQYVGYLMLACFVGFVLFFSRRFRNLVGYEGLLSRLPLADKIRRIDDTAFRFRSYPRQSLVALFVTLVTHFFFITSIYFFARRWASHIRKIQGGFYLAVLLATMVGYLFAAVPISVQGFGLMEAVFWRVLVKGGWCNYSEMVLLTLGARMIQMVWATPGIIVPWLGFERPHEPDASASEDPG